MKKVLVFFLFILMNLAFNNSAEELKKFYNKYKLSSNELTILNKNKKYLAEEEDDVFTWKDYLPGFYIKRESSLDRIINAERMRQSIKKYNLFCFDVPRKYIYSYKKQLYVLAEEVDGISLGVLSVEEIKQLIILILATGYSDLNTSNIIRRKSDKKLIIIDTDKEAFLLDRNYALSAFYSLFGNADHIDSEGRFFIDNYKKSYEPLIYFDEKSNILTSVEFDEEIGIDLNRVKEEYGLEL